MKKVDRLKYLMGFYYVGKRIPIGLWCIRNFLWNTQSYTSKHKRIRNIQLWLYHFLSLLCDRKFFKEKGFTPGALQAWTTGKKFIGIPYE